MTRAATIALALALGLVGGCDGAPTIDAGPAATDGGAPDAGPVDAGPDLPGWRSEPSLPTRMQEVAVATLGTRVYVAGGFIRGAVTPRVFIFDASTSAWTDGPALPAPRHHMSLVAHGGDLYALGGMEGLSFEPLDTAWVLRAGASEWTPIASLPDARGAGAAASIGDVLVLAGGNMLSGRLASETLLYDPAGDAWRFGAPIPTEREHLAAVAHQGELYVLAGRRNSLDSTRVEVEIYDPVADAWRGGPALPSPRGGFGAAILGGGLYVHGGEESRTVHATMDRLDLATMTWSAAPPSPTPHHGHGLVAIGARLYAIGGGDAPSLAAVDTVESFRPQ